jgi:hypothetical protein
MLQQLAALDVKCKEILNYPFLMNDKMHHFIVSLVNKKRKLLDNFYNFEIPLNDKYIFGLIFYARYNKKDRKVKELRKRFEELVHRHDEEVKK